MSDKQLRCKLDGNILVPCWLLNEAIEENYWPRSRRKGLSALVIYDFGKQPSQISKSGVVLRGGNLPREGVVLNYCPFCGADIQQGVTGERDEGFQPLVNEENWAEGAIEAGAIAREELEGED